jgi:hypothetical protein
MISFEKEITGSGDDVSGVCWRALPGLGIICRLTNDETQLLSALGQSDPHAASRLLPLVHDALRKLAAQRMAH